MGMVVSTKAKEAGAILQRLFKTSDLKFEAEPLLDRLAKLYPGVIFTWDHGLHVKVPTGMALPRAIEYFARKIDVVLEDGSLVNRKDRLPEPVIGPSVWELVRKPRL